MWLAFICGRVHFRIYFSRDSHYFLESRAACLAALGSEQNLSPTLPFRSSNILLLLLISISASHPHRLSLQASSGASGKQSNFRQIRHTTLRSLRSLTADLIFIRHCYLESFKSQWPTASNPTIPMSHRLNMVKMALRAPGQAKTRALRNYRRYVVALCLGLCRSSEHDWWHSSKGPSRRCPPKSELEV